MTLRVLFAICGFAAIALAAQAPPGEIAGRMSDEQRAALPGVRIRITNGHESTDAVTDREGRFLFRSLTMGTYRVVAELAGFKTASGEIAISRSTPRAFLAWSLEVGCLAEVQRVMLPPRDAARRVEGSEER